MGASARFALPFLAAGQAQKEVVHNEAVQLLDLIVAAAVEDEPMAVPPASPQVGATYIVAPGATGDWSGKDLSLAGYTAGGWRFVAPREGTLAYIVSGSVWAVFRAGSWEIGAVRGDSVVIGGQQVVGARSSAIASPAGGTVIDAEARTAVGEILAALRIHGLIAS